MAVYPIAGYPQSTGAKVMSTALVTGPALYAAGGFSLEAVSFGLRYIESAFALTQMPNIALTDLFAVCKINITSPASNATSFKVGVHTVADGAEVAAGTVLSSRVFVVTVIGTL